MFYTSQQKNGSYRSILGVILGVIIFSGLFSVLFSKKALASNDYIDNIHFSINSFGYVVMTFHTKTTFTVQYDDLGELWGYKKVCRVHPGVFLLQSQYPPDYYMRGWDWFLPDTMSPLTFNCQDTTYQAGQTYEVILFDAYLFYDENFHIIPTSFFIPILGVPNSNTIFTNFGFQSEYGGLIPPWTDTEIYYFSQTPSISISYPHDNDEIAGAFNIQGTFSIPTGKSADYITISFDPVGAGYSLLTHFSQYISGQSQGTFSIPVSGIPLGYYDITISFVGGDYDGYIGATIHNVHLVNDIPPVLPSGETTPSSPIFGYISPDIYYSQHSNYSTSTGLFNNLTNSVGALIENVGNSLSAFAGKFSLSDAQQTATMVASSISTIRTYSNNLNSFFGSLPVSQILFLYLILFVAVIVFRLIKNLVNLIKP